MCAFQNSVKFVPCSSLLIISGPDDVEITNADKAVATVTGLHIHETSPTVYTFQLNVTNHRNLSSVATVNVTVYKG